MFFNLAWRNAKRSRNENLIYFLTMVTAVASFYIILSLGQQDVIRFLRELESSAVEKLLTTVMPMVYLCALLFIFFLVVFANKYQLECRSRELGLYLMFGMKKKRLFFQLMMEGFITSLLALFGGIICGSFLSEIISLATARLVGQGIITHQSSFSIGAVIWTTIGLLLIQALSLFILGGKTFKREVHQLLYGEMVRKQNTGTASGGLFTLLVGVILLAVAYWVALKHFFAAGGAMLFVAVLFGIAGTLLFIRGLARLLSLFAGSIKNKSTKGLYTFTLRQLQENVVCKYVSISVASLLMMFTIMLIADGSSSIMTYRKNLSRGSSVYDFTVMGDDMMVEQYLSSEKMKPYVAHLNRMETGKIKKPEAGSINSFVDWSKFRAEIVQHLPSDVVDPATQDTGSYTMAPDNPPALNILGIIDTGSYTPYLVPASTYSRLLEASGETPLILGEDEAVFYINPDFIGSAQEDESSMLDEIFSKAKSTNTPLLSIDGKPFFFTSSVTMKGLTADKNIRITSALIVSDEVFEKYVDQDTCMVYWNFCIPGETANEKGLMKSIMDANHLLKPSGFVYESYLNNFGRQLFYVIAGSYTSLYMGFMFLIIACALLSLQFLTQMQATKERYLTLSMLGANHKQMKKSINKQVLWYFLLPLLLACISGSVGLFAMQKHLHSSQAAIVQSYPLMFIMAGSVIVVLVIYAVAVAQTANREIGKLKWKINS
ncbi:MAG: FtsX-like permease family protein [Anaerocolumna aminovalerica]|uniref:FtsX-like permease family protein n=1 Tax=Anaerocolumna aminovalerica TaxID=1527 RepID=UPI001C0F27A1|nr:FtsX-like permease family protein [Anaerocolumna aminovalerica]MBU5332566.1 ABC transporter permease [Anaerocolumna aminovalerica]MDU6264900.1 FtsX-like permease family protein [Anaerocolumna aminovalerica]